MSSHSDAKVIIAVEHSGSTPGASTTEPPSQSRASYASSEGWSPGSMAPTTSMSEPSYSSQGWNTSPISTYSPYTADPYTFDYLSPYGTSPISPRPRASSTGDYGEE